MTDLHLESHHGTHMDAPTHFYENLKSVDQLDVNQFVGLGVCLLLE